MVGPRPTARTRQESMSCLHDHGLTQMRRWRWKRLLEVFTMLPMQDSKDKSAIGRTDGYGRFAITKTFGSLDGLRAIAILAVLWHHHADNAIRGWSITKHGFLGVDLFFTISGFLIVTLLLRERRRTTTVSLRDFYVRRFLRIFPPYYLTLLVVGAVSFFKPEGTTSEAVRHDLPYAIFFLSNLVPMQSLLGITWSLSVEEQFYIITPAVEKYARRALIILLPLAYVLVSLPPFGAFAAFPFPAFFRETTFGPILLGAMLAHVLDDPRGFLWASRLASLRFAPLVALGLVCAAASYPSEEFVGWPRLATHWAMLALVASCVAREDNLLAPLLSLWPIRRIGAVSYGIYLYHLLVMHFVLMGLGAAGIMSGFSTFVGTTLGAWAVAEMSYRFFEIRFLALKARFSPATSPHATSQRAVTTERTTAVSGS
jgi:peptidoglycan/LPS O-acetylase OafA/YrhL